jgi:hypothetical protein
LFIQEAPDSSGIVLPQLPRAAVKHKIAKWSIPLVEEVVKRRFYDPAGFKGAFGSRSVESALPGGCSGESIRAGEPTLDPFP